MWFPHPAKLAATPKAVQFVALRWHEFFDSNTPDSFQPRLCQLPMLVDEVYSAAVDAVANPEHNHTKPLRQELDVRVKGVVEETVCTSRQKFLLRTVSTAEKPGLIRDAASQLQREGFREHFENAVLNQGAIEIEKAFVVREKKSVADEWLGAWATLALDRGYLSREDKIEPRLNLLDRPLDGLLNDIRSRLDGRKRRYACVLDVCLTQSTMKRSESDLEEARSAVMAVLQKAGGILVPRGTVAELPERIAVYREIEAVGGQAALATFARQIQPALNLLDLYRNGPTTKRVREGWFGSTLADLKTAKVREASLPRLHPRSKAQDLTLNALSDDGLAGKIDVTIANALEIYHVAMATEDRRVRFLTLWSALECLAQAVDGDRTMERIGKLVAPIVIWRRMEKHLRYLTICLKFLRDSNPALVAAPVAALPNVTADEVRIEDVLETLSKPDGHPRLASMGTHCSGHSLLLYRVLRAWELFHSPATLRGDLLNAHQRLDWQLDRIYRARNLLIHRGEENHLLPHLSINLQYYFSTVISRLLHGVGQNSDTTARQAAYRWCSNYHYVIDQLAGKANTLRMVDLLPSPDRTETEVLWP